MTTPLILQIASDYFWLVALAFTGWNFVTGSRAVHRAAARSGASGEEIDLYARRFAVGAAAPWFVMGLGQLSGQTRSVFDYLRPQDTNPFVLAWIALVLLLSALQGWWIAFGGGAEKVRDLDLLALVLPHGPRPRSIVLIKAVALLGPVFVLVWVVALIGMDAPPPLLPSAGPTEPS